LIFLKLSLVNSFIILNFIKKIKFLNKKFLLDKIGDWGLGIGEWGLGIGHNRQSPIPNPQSPIPNPLFFLNNIF